MLLFIFIIVRGTVFGIAFFFLHLVSESLRAVKNVFEVQTVDEYPDVSLGVILFILAVLSLGAPFQAVSYGLFGVLIFQYRSELGKLSARYALHGELD